MIEIHYLIDHTKMCESIKNIEDEQLRFADIARVFFIDSYGEYYSLNEISHELRDSIYLEKDYGHILDVLRYFDSSEFGTVLSENPQMISCSDFFKSVDPNVLVNELGFVSTDELNALLNAQNGKEIVTFGSYDSIDELIDELNQEGCPLSEDCKILQCDDLIITIE